MISMDLKPGDKIVLDDGSTAKIIEVRRGFIKYEHDTAVLIYHTKGWSQIPANDEVEIDS